MPNAPPFRLTTIDQRAELFAAAGADAMLEFHFDAAMADMTADHWISEILARQLGAAGVVTGEDFTFGKARSGSVALLESEGAKYGIGARAVGAVDDGHGTISSTRIREAIKSLAAKGLLEVTRRVGTLVLEPTRWNLFDTDIIVWRAESTVFDPTLSRDLMEMRRIIEPAAVRLAAQRASDEDRRNLRSAYMAMARAVAGKGDYVKADLAFHTTILSACGNQFVRQMQDAMGALLRVSFEVITTKPGGPAHSLPLHEAVCEAIERGDADAAERAAMILIEGAEEDLRELIPQRAPPQQKSAR